MKRIECPTPEELADLHSGRLPKDRLDDIQAHLDDCSSCLSWLDRQRPHSDRLLAGLRALEAAGPELPYHQPRSPEAPEGRSAGPQPRLPALSTGGRLGSYQLLEVLGRGGMGDVYRARHEFLDRIVALKVLPADRLADPQSVERFKREMVAVGRLNHPHIVAARDGGEADGVHFLVMEYVEGLDLSELVRRRGPLRVADASEIARQAADALEYAARSSIVHRDIKPSNLRLTPEGRVMILDFGIARLWDHQRPGDYPTLTRQLLIGTPAFMAPEQAYDAHEADIRADLYSLGCTLYHLLSGHPPFAEHRHGLRQIQAHVEQPAPAIQKERSGVPDGLAAVLDRLMAKNPDDRYQRPADLAGALAPFARGSCLAGLVDEAAEPDSLAHAIPEHPAPVAAVSRPDAGPGGYPQDKPSPSSPPKRRGFWAVAPVAAMLCLGGAWAAWQAVVVRDDRGIVVAEGPLKLGDVVTTQPAPTKAVPNRSEAPPEAEKQKPGPDLKVASASPPQTGPRKPQGPGLNVASAPPPPQRPQTPPPIDLTKLTPVPIPVKPREPMSEYALVTRPDPLPGALSWTIATREISGGAPMQAFQPGGGVIAVGDDAGTIRLFDGKTDRLRRVIITGADSVRALAWSPDGRLLASSGYFDPRKHESGSVVQVWDAERGSLLRLAHRPGKALALDWSPNGRLLASHGGGVWLWDIPGDWSKRLCDSPFGVSAWAPDGTRLAVRGEDAIGIHDIDLGRSLMEIPLKGERPALLAWSPDGKTLAAVSENNDMSVGLFDPNTGGHLRTIAPETSKTQSMQSGALLWKSDSASFVTVTPSTLQLWDAGTGTLKQTLLRFSSTGLPFAAKLALATDEDIALSTIGGGDRTEFAVWDVKEHKPRYAIACYGQPYETKWSPHGLGATQANWKIRLVSTSSTTFPGPPDDAELPHDSMHEKAWSPTRNLLAYCDRQDRFVILDGDTGLTRYLEAKAPMVIAWSPDGATIASASSGPSALAGFASQTSVTISEVSSGRALRTLDGTFRSPILAWSPDGKRLAVVSAGGLTKEKDSIGVFETATGRCVQRFSDNVRQDPARLFSKISGLAWSPDGSAIVTKVDKWMQICDAKTGSLFKEYEEPNVAGPIAGPAEMRWSKDGQSIKLLGMREGKGVFVERDRMGRTLHETGLSASGDAFFPDDRVVSGDRPLLRLCETSKGETILTIVLFADGRSLNVSPEGYFAGRPGVEQRLVYVVLTGAGQETLPPEEFRTRYPHWRNDESRALFQPKAPAPSAVKVPVAPEPSNGPRAGDLADFSDIFLKATEEAAKEVSRVQGKWRGASVDNGETWDVDIHGNEITAKVEGTGPKPAHYVVYKKGRFSVGPPGIPRSFDLTGWSTWDGTQYLGDAFHPGIYTLSDGVLTLRVADDRQPRPTAFRAKSPIGSEPPRAYYPVQIELRKVRDGGR